MIITFVPLKARILQLTMLDWRIAGTRIPANLFQHLEICGWSWLEMPLGKLYTFQSFLGSLVLVGWMCEKEGAYPPDHFFFGPNAFDFPFHDRLESNMGLEAIKTEFWYTHSIRSIAMNWHQYDIWYMYIYIYHLLSIAINWHELPCPSRSQADSFSSPMFPKMVQISKVSDCLRELQPGFPRGGPPEDINTGRSIAGFRHGYN